MRTKPKHPQETKLLRFPFRGDIEKGETIVFTQLLSIVTQAGADASPALVIEGDPIVDNAELDVYLRVRGGLDGCDYFGELLAIDSQTLRHVMQFTLPVRALIARN